MKMSIGGVKCSVACQVSFEVGDISLEMDLRDVQGLQCEDNRHTEEMRKNRDISDSKAFDIIKEQIDRQVSDQIKKAFESK